MESKDLVVINGQLCSKDVAMLIIEKVLPTVLVVDFIKELFRGDFFGLS